MLGLPWRRSADTSYDKPLDKFTSSQAGRLLRSVTEPVISTRLRSAKPRAWWGKLLDTSRIQRSICTPRYRNLKVLGRYSLTVSVPRGGLRPLRAPDAGRADDDDNGGED